MTKLAQTPPERIKEVKEFLKKTKNIHEKDRARAIVKLIEGKSRRIVADFLEVNIATVDEWQRRFRQYGIAGLKSKPQKGNRHLLTRKQKDEVKQTITKKRPEEEGLEGKFWNVPLLKRYVANVYRVSYRSPASYRRLFAYCGFTFHKPVKVNKKQRMHTRKRFEVKLKKRLDGTQEKAVWYW